MLLNKHYVESQKLKMISQLLFTLNIAFFSLLSKAGLLKLFCSTTPF